MHRHPHDIEEELGDGYQNDFQRAFAESQANTPRVELEEVGEGPFIVEDGYPYHCPTTDAFITVIITKRYRFKTPEEAEAKAMELSGATASEVYIDECVFVKFPPVQGCEPKPAFDPDEPPF